MSIRGNWSLLKQGELQYKTHVLMRLLQEGTVPSDTLSTSYCVSLMHLCAWGEVAWMCMDFLSTQDKSCQPIQHVKLPVGLAGER